MKIMYTHLLTIINIAVIFNHVNYSCALCVSQYQQRANTSKCITMDKLLKEDIRLLSPPVLIIDGLVDLYVPLRYSDHTKISLIGQNNGTLLCSNYSGVSVYNVTRLIIENLTFQYCSLLANSTGTKVSDKFSSDNRQNWLYPSALHIEKCSYITIKKSTFKHNHGVGLSIYDPVDEINIEECQFQENQILTEFDTLPGGGGLHIELTTCPPGIYSRDRSIYCTPSHEMDQSKHTVVSISKCIFENNNSTTINNDQYVKIDKGTYERFGRGGGLIFLAEGTTRVELELIDCVFRGNSAQWGGGMLVVLTEKATNARLTVHNSTFVNNTGRSGGGGVYLQLSHTIPVNNISMSFKSCDFLNNSAEIGGGFVLLTREHYQSTHNTLSFIHCNWWNNYARYSAAMDLSRTERSSYTRDALTPQFINCSFIDNHVLNSETTIKDSSANFTDLGKGTLMTLYFTIVFQVHVSFEKNVGSALYLISSNATFSSGITTVFNENHGINGGAFCLKASSIVKINPNSTFNIYNNTASSVGGAIFYSGIGEHQLHDKTHTCIFDAIINVKDIQINFSGNRHYSNKVNSVYASPLYACVQTCTSDTFITREMLLLCNSGVKFDKNTSLQIQGEGSNVELITNLSESLKVFPGINFSLPFNLTDACKNEQAGSFTAKIISGNNVTVHSDYAYFIGKQMKLIGNSGSKAKLSLRRRNRRSFEVTMNVELLQCPPGLHLDTNRNPACVCRYNGVSVYHMIICGGSQQQKALLISGYWAGYIGHSTPTPSSFYTAICPIGFCQYNTSNVKSLYRLPKTVSVEDMDTFMCGSSRSGVLCGECRKGYSAYYHSPTLECKEDKLCKFGWLFYIMSELLPLTTFFAVMILFNVKVTSGAANGFIFYCQVVSALVVSSYRKQKYLPNQINFLVEAYLFIYRCFNMEFFKHNRLSFCLWKGATTLDILVFTYITIFYAFLLVMFTVVILKYCTCCLGCSQRKSTSYAIHGLSTFLIMCYVRCTGVSFQILTSSNPMGELQVYIKRKRVFYSGNHEYFDKHHIIYAIPASICIVIIVIPPCLLLWYPLGPKLLQKCGLAESKAFKALSILVPIHRLQPLMDSFQSCYKDNCRFVSGLYFLYRMAILAAFAGATGFDQFYTLAQVLLIGMTVLHATAQPYKNWWHNIYNASLFAILSTVNALSMYIVSQQVRLDQIAINNILYASTFQLILVYTPLILLLICSTFKLIKIIRTKYRSSNNFTEADELTDFPARLIYSDDYSLDEADTEAIPNRCKSNYIRND